jgi:hypothetical protein
MQESDERKVPILLWPFYAVWRLLTFVLEFTSRLICAFIGLGLMVGGTALTITIAGAPIGVPLILFGFLLLVRALF